MRTSFHHQPEAQHPKSFSYRQERRPITPSFGGKADSNGRVALPLTKYEPDPATGAESQQTNARFAEREYPLLRRVGESGVSAHTGKTASAERIQQERANRGKIFQARKGARFLNFRYIEAIGDMPAGRTSQRKYRAMGRKTVQSFAVPRERPGLTSDLADLVHELVKGLFDPYRPELHCMRGPGPKQQTVFFASSATEILTPTGFLDQIARSPQAVREVLQRLSQRLREADDRVVNHERRSGRAHGTRKEARSQTAVESVHNAYLAAKNPWLRRQFATPLGLGDLPFIVGRGPVAGEGLPPLQPDLKLDDTVPFRLSRNHFMIEKRDGNYYVRDLCSTLGTIVNGEPIGDFRGDDAPLRAGENEVIAGGVDSSFVFSVFIA